MQLVLINISDHWTRTKANAGGGAGGDLCMLGALLGSQVGGWVGLGGWAGGWVEWGGVG